MASARRKPRRSPAKATTKRKQSKQAGPNRAAELSPDRWSHDLREHLLNIVSSSEEEGRSPIGVAAAFVQRFLQLTGVEAIAIHLRDEQTKELTCLAEAGGADARTAKEAKRLLARAERDGHAANGDLQAFALHRVGRLEGLILIHTGSKTAQQRTRIVKTLAAAQPWLAVALDHARLTRKYAAKIVRIQHLEQVSDVLNSTLSEDDKLRRAVDAAVRLLEAEVGALFLTGQTAALELRALAGERAESIKGLESPTAAGVAKSGQALLVKDGQQDTRLAADQGWQGTMPVRTLVSVPVRAGEETVGVVEVVNKRTGKPFSNWDLLELSSLSNQFGLAIENFRLKK
jgi:GAF domain-containing protein